MQEQAVDKGNPNKTEAEMEAERNPPIVPEQSDASAEGQAGQGEAPAPQQEMSASEKKKLEKEEEKKRKAAEKLAKEADKKKDEPKEADSAPIGKPEFPEDALIATQMRLVDLAEMVHEAIGACIFKGNKPWIQCKLEERQKVMELVRLTLTHRQPSPAVVHANMNKLFQIQDAVAHHACAPHEQRPAHLVFGIVMGFKKQE